MNTSTVLISTATITVLTITSMSTTLPNSTKASTCINPGPQTRPASASAGRDLLADQCN